MEVNGVVKMTISDFFNMCENEDGQYQIDTPSGWEDINFLVKKNNKECYRLSIEDGTELECSSTHKILTSNGWKKSSNIDMQRDLIFMRGGNKKIVKKKWVGIKDTFDLQVDSDAHSYFSNDVVSHNCGKSLVCKAISSTWGMPLLRLDFGRLFGSLVGDSEKNVREAIKLAEAVAPCVTEDTIIELQSCRESIGNLYDIAEKTFRINENTDISVFRYPLKIKSFSRGTDNIAENNLNAIVRRKVNNKIVCKVILEDEKTIKVTEDHKFLIIDKNGNQCWEKIKYITEEEKIITKYNDRVKIAKIERVDGVDYVYDPCCDDPYNYISNGIVSHNCILWIDEIEKAISGIASSGRTDGGTTSRVLSTFLTWMQEKTSPVFVVATANDHSTIPPEFLRAGRFDEVFFVDLPNRDEREEIFEVLLRLRNIDAINFNLSILAGKSENFSGAEIERSIDNAMLVGFRENQRAIDTDDIIKTLGESKTLFEMRKADFEELREWADSQCVKANEEYVQKVSYSLDSTRDLDL